jgi:hypothetical protein
MITLVVCLVTITVRLAGGDRMRVDNVNVGGQRRKLRGNRHVGNSQCLIPSVKRVCGSTGSNTAAQEERRCTMEAGEVNGVAAGKSLKWGIRRGWEGFYLVFFPAARVARQRICSWECSGLRS